MVNQSVTETKDEPEYSLSAVHRIAGFQQVVYVSRRVQKHVNDLGYQLDDVCALLCSLDEDDFRKSERYVDDQRWHDVYLLRHPTLNAPRERRSEEHTSELQSLMRISYAVFCLKKQQHIHT